MSNLNEVFKAKYYDGRLEKEVPAYHQKGKIEPMHIINIITGTIDLDKLNNYHRKRPFLLSFGIYTLQTYI